MTRHKYILYIAKYHCDIEYHVQQTFNWPTSVNFIVSSSVTSSHTSTTDDLFSTLLMN